MDKVRQLLRDKLAPQARQSVGSSLVRFRSSKSFQPVVAVVALALVGVLVLFTVHASGLWRQLQPERGTLSGAATVVNDTSASGQQAIRFGSGSGYYNWKPLRIGGGGMITGIDETSDGLYKVIRTDTYGAYRWNSAGDNGHGVWEQIVTASTMPTAYVRAATGTGVWEIAMAHSDHTRLYMAYIDKVFTSNDYGSHWSVASSGLPSIDFNPNDHYRMRGPKMAVDPTNPSIVYLGTPTNGLYETTNGGASWSRVSGIGTGHFDAGASGQFDPYDGVNGIAFDGSSKIYVSVSETIANGGGVWVSNDSGANWAHTAAGGPISVHEAVVVNHVYYAAGYESTAQQSRGWRYHQVGGAWVWDKMDGLIQRTGTLNIQSVSGDPFDSRHIVVVDADFKVYQTPDDGATWNRPWHGSGPGCNDDSCATHGGPNDPPWLGPAGATPVRLMFDPLVRNRFWLASGTGVWYSDLTPTEANVYDYYSQSRGIEQLVARDAITPPGGDPIISNEDFGVFRVKNPDDFTAQLRYAYASNGKPFPFADASSLDYSSTDPRFIVNTATKIVWDPTTNLYAGYSTDGGTTWTRFPTMPGGFNTQYQYGFGSIAVGRSTDAAHTDIVWAGGAENWNTSWPYHSGDRGSSWQLVRFIEDNGAAEDPNQRGTAFAQGFNNGPYYNMRRIVTQDKVSGDFYIYNNAKGIFKSTDGGATFVHVTGTVPFDQGGYSAVLRAVPGKSGELFYTSGQEGTLPNITAGPLKRTIAGPQDWHDVPNVLAISFGFGKAAPGTDYPTIFFIGWYRGNYGIYRSIDNAASWLKIGDYPAGQLAGFSTIQGDLNVFGRVYIGLGGDGWVYGDGH